MVIWCPKSIFKSLLKLSTLISVSHRVTAILSELRRLLGKPVKTVNAPCYLWAGECIMFERESAVESAVRLARDCPAFSSAIATSYNLSKVLILLCWYILLEIQPSWIWKNFAQCTKQTRQYMFKFTLCYVCMQGLWNAERGVLTIQSILGSIAMNLEVMEITDKYSRLVAYSLGGRVLTAHDIHNLCGGQYHVWFLVFDLFRMICRWLRFQGIIC